MIVTEQTKLSIEEYLALEEETGERHEYIGGEVRMMADTTLEHEMIVNNLIRLLTLCLREKGCTLVSGQMRLYTPHCDKAFLFPDIHIYCGGIKKEKMPQGAYALVNPSFIIEVLSQDRRNYDRGDKFDCYRQISSLQSYVLIESKLETHDPAVYVRTWEDDRQFQEKKLELTDTLDVLGCSVACQEIYNFSV
jgi:Uma2 family endonuclease